MYISKTLSGLLAISEGRFRVDLEMPWVNFSWFGFFGGKLEDLGSLGRLLGSSWGSSWDEIMLQWAALLSLPQKK